MSILDENSVDGCDFSFQLSDWLSGRQGTAISPRILDHDSVQQIVNGDPTEMDGAKRRNTSHSSQRPTARLPRKAVRVLEEWLLQHRQSPYPAQREQSELKALTGLKRSQIRNWFANARKRGRAQALQPDAPSPSQQQSAPVEMLSLFPQVSQMHPFERWLHLGLEHEAASPQNIYEAVVASRQQRLDAINRTMQKPVDPRQRRGRSTNWQYYRKAASSVSSLEIRSYAANAKSVCSDQWKLDESSPPNAIPPRRQHRQGTRRNNHLTASNTRACSLKFQCTFCTDRFKKKHDWQRHEKSQHLPLEKWVCCLQGSVNVDPGTNNITCVFCGQADPEPEHIHAHGYTRCISRPCSERTFYRKDHLRQHLRLMHNGCSMISSMESWKSMTTQLESRCGFCNSNLTTWQARVQHLADHFESGAQMEDWEGDWGFEPEIMACLGRATLPAFRRKPLAQTASSDASQSKDIGIAKAMVNYHADLEMPLNWDPALDPGLTGTSNATDESITVNTWTDCSLDFDAMQELDFYAASTAFDEQNSTVLECSESVDSSFLGSIDIFNSLNDTVLSQDAMLCLNDGLALNWQNEGIDYRDISQQLAVPESTAASCYSAFSAQCEPPPKRMIDPRLAVSDDMASVATKTPFPYDLAAVEPSVWPWEDQ